MNQPSEVWLWKRQSQQLVVASLHDALTTEAICEAAQSWQPFVEEHLRTLSATSPLNTPQHIHWDWERKAQAVAGLLAYQTMGIRCEEQMQGLMLVATAGKVCQLTAQKAKPLVYIHFLATAPWNDSAFVPQPRFGLVGSVLLAAAIQMSKDNAFHGRIGLHSLPQAEMFYRRCGMTELGVDSQVEHLVYFEMTPEQAQAFLNRGRT